VKELIKTLMCLLIIVLISNGFGYFYGQQSADRYLIFAILTFVIMTLNKITKIEAKQ